MSIACTAFHCPVAAAAAPAPAPAGAGSAVAKNNMEEKQRAEKKVGVCGVFGVGMGGWGVGGGG